MFEIGVTGDRLFQIRIDGYQSLTDAERDLARIRELPGYADARILTATRPPLTFALQLALTLPLTVPLTLPRTLRPSFDLIERGYEFIAEVSARIRSW